MAWENMSFKDLHYWTTSGGYNMTRATVQGVTFYKSNREYHEIELPSSNRSKKVQAPKEDGRVAFNKSRSGKPLERTGNCIRTAEIRRRIHSWVGSIGGAKRIRFFTITFPEGTQDQDGQKALNIWLTRLRKADPRIRYFWTAERQQNQTIHYHLLIDRHMSIQMVNGWMKSTLINMGDKIPWSNQDHAAIYGGVNVKKKVYSGHGVEKYLIKYLTKSAHTGISQPWHSSRELGKLAVRVRKPSSIMKGVLVSAMMEARRQVDSIRLFWENGILYIPFPDGYNLQVSQWLSDFNGYKHQAPDPHFEYRSRASLVAQSLGIQLQSVATTDTAKSQPQLVLSSEWTRAQHYQTRK